MQERCHLLAPPTHLFPLQLSFNFCKFTADRTIMVCLEQVWLIAGSSYCALQGLCFAFVVKRSKALGGLSCAGT
ncbi:hypothetical protein Pfo_011766 [Paulownia fortunei]|nr:hypothetical protein Pfo_011766 [Paulownia fortunei]